jgi:Flp pilus assembly protein TadB
MTLVGDADRERALAVLRRHYAEGRLDPDELTSRVHVAALARSTADVRAALRGLPNGLLEAVLAPRLRAAGTALGEVPALRTARRIALAAIVSAVWLSVTMVLLIAYTVSLLVSGPSTAATVIFAAGWLLATWVSWRVWRRGSRRSRP